MRALRPACVRMSSAHSDLGIFCPFFPRKFTAKPGEHRWKAHLWPYHRVSAGFQSGFGWPIPEYQVLGPLLLYFFICPLGHCPDGTQIFGLNADFLGPQTWFWLYLAPHVFFHLFGRRAWSTGRFKDLQIFLEPSPAISLQTVPYWGTTGSFFPVFTKPLPVLSAVRVVRITKLVIFILHSCNWTQVDYKSA